MTEVILVDLMNAILARLDRMDTRFDQIDTRFDQIDTRLNQMDVGINALQIGLNILQAKQENSMKGREEPLKKIIKSDGSQPVSEYPVIEQLLVSGLVMLPSGGQNHWSARKSLLLIQEYEPGYTTDGDVENEMRSRPRRLKVAQLLGVTSSQLNFGLLSL
jgi:hypothetical protein